jgi:deoxycytidine triphosphate deaminase
MTTLCAETILTLIDCLEPPLIEPPGEWFSDDAREDWIKRMQRVEGGAFELTVDRVLRPAMPGDAICKLSIQDRVVKATHPIEWSDENNVALFPGDYYLLQSAETLNMPPWLYARVEPRTTLFRMGSSMDCASAHPGYSGVITVGLYVHSCSSGILLGRGARFCNLHFLEFDSRRPQDTHPYGGIWSGNKTDTGGKCERAF